MLNFLTTMACLADETTLSSPYWIQNILAFRKCTHKYGRSAQTLSYRRHFWSYFRPCNQVRMFKLSFFQITSQAGKLFNVSGETSGDCLQIPQQVSESKIVLLSAASIVTCDLIGLNFKVKDLVLLRLTIFSNWYIPILASQTRNSAKVSCDNTTWSSKTENILWQS